MIPQLVHGTRLYVEFASNTLQYCIVHPVNLRLDCGGGGVAEMMPCKQLNPLMPTVDIWVQL